jgi:uncharacterized protein YtpQ (UPF0354 family)
MSRSKQAVLSSVAYLKRALPEEPLPGEHLVELSYADTPVMKDLENGLLVAYLVDQGDSYGYVQYKDLETAGVGEPELHTAGIENLRLLAEQRLRVQQYGSIFTLLMGGTFEASMLLLDDLWERSFAEYVDGPFLVAIPARDVLAFGDASSPGAVIELNAVVERLIGAGNAELATMLFRRQGGAWYAHDA